MGRQSAGFAAAKGTSGAGDDDVIRRSLMPPTHTDYAHTMGDRGQRYTANVKLTNRTAAAVAAHEGQSACGRRLRARQLHRRCTATAEQQLGPRGLVFSF